MLRRYFNERAGIWDSTAAETDSGKLEQMAMRLELRPAMTVLDIGTGTGIFLPYLLRPIGPSGRVIALDIAEKMLMKALCKGIAGNIGFLCADVEHIPLAHSTCDAAVCYSSFPHFQNKLKALGEMKRVLKDGCCLYVCHTSGRDAINRIHGKTPLLDRDLLPDASEMYSLLLMMGFTRVLVEDTSDSYFARAVKPA